MHAEKSFTLFFGKEDGNFYKLLSDSVRRFPSDMPALCQSEINGQRILLKTPENMISAREFHEIVKPFDSDTSKHFTKLYW